MAEQRHVSRTLGHYRLVRLLGQGGFAEVYLGEHIHLNTAVAVKILHTRLQENDIQDFRREAQTVARLVHPNIVRVLDFGVEQSVPYLVMDYAPNGSVRQRYPKGTRLPLPVIVTQANQIAAALQHAHNQRLIHRDVKPENILLSPNNELLLSDFGLALVLQSSSVSHSHSIAGTIAYMAPEQIQAHPVPASDQYALGVIVYEWLCGRRPFDGSYTEVAVKHSITPPPSPRTFSPDISAAVEQVILTALQKDPGQRYPTINAFAQALGQAAEPTASDGEQFIPTVVRQPGSSSPQLSGPPTPPVAVSQMPTSVPYAPMNTPPPHMPVAGSMPPYQNHTPYPVMMPTVSTQWTPATSTVVPQKSVTRRIVMAGGIAGTLALIGGGAWWLTSGPLAERINTIIPGSLTFLAEQTYSDHKDLVWLIAWSPDGKYIASGSFDTTLKIWTADTQETKLVVRSTKTPAEADNYPWSLSWSTNNLLAVSFVDGTVQVLDPAASKRVQQLEEPFSGTPDIAWSPDEKYLAISAFTDGIYVCEYPSWNVVQTFKEHTESVDAVAWSPDGKYIASGSSDTTVRVWEPLTAKQVIVSNKHTDRIAAVSWSPDSKCVVSSAQDRTVVAWNVETGQVIFNRETETGAPMGTVSWSPNGKYIALYDGHAQVDILHASTGEVKQSLQTGVIYGVSWSPDNTKLAVACYENKAEIWPVEP